MWHYNNFLSFDDAKKKFLEKQERFSGRQKKNFGV
jgi:hypothetical protein